MGHFLQRFFQKKTYQKLYNSINMTSLPNHVAIIMDGNGRWAQERGLPRALGHRTGMESLKTIARICLKLGIKVLTVYAFSTENWKRPQDEIDILMDLLYEYIHKELNELDRQGVQIRAIGRLDDLPILAQQEVTKAMQLTAENNKMILNIALNYGGRSEIVDAVNKIAGMVAKGELRPGEITEEIFQHYLYTGDLPNPDLLIRPAGELRISNFLLWQLAYTEFYITSVYWPDFREKEFLEALIAYQNRERRFGGL